MDKFKKWFFNEDEEEFEYDNSIEQSIDRSGGKEMKNPRLPRGIIDVMVVFVDEIEKMSIVGDAMKEGKIVAVKISENILVRALDFISGVQYALGYKEQKMTKNDYIFIPKNVNLDKEYAKKVESN